MRSHFLQLIDGQGLEVEVFNNQQGFQHGILHRRFRCRKQASREPAVCLESGSSFRGRFPLGFPSEAEELLSQLALFLLPKPIGETVQAFGSRGGQLCQEARLVLLLIPDLPDECFGLLVQFGDPEMLALEYGPCEPGTLPGHGQMVIAAAFLVEYTDEVAFSLLERGRLRLLGSYAVPCLSARVTAHAGNLLEVSGLFVCAEPQLGGII